MGLKNNASTAAATSEARFEAEGEDNVVDAQPSAEAAASTSTAVAPQGSRAVVAASGFKNVMADFKDAMPVEWDTLPRVSAEQGGFVFKDDGAEELGSEISLQLISTQESWVASPNDTKADIELVKFADNDTTARDGTDLAQHIENLKEQGYTKAKINHRLTLVGELTKASGDASRVGELIQIDMPDSGRRAFNTYQVQASFKVSRGKLTVDEATHLNLKAVKAQVTGSKDTYTKITFPG